MLGQSGDTSPAVSTQMVVSQILTLSSICCVTLAKTSNLSKSQFLHEKLEKYCCSQRITQRTNGIPCAEGLAQSQAWNRCYTTRATMSLVPNKTSCDQNWDMSSLRAGARHSSLGRVHNRDSVICVDQRGLKTYYCSGQYLPLLSYIFIPTVAGPHFKSIWDGELLVV